VEVKSVHAGWLVICRKEFAQMRQNKLIVGTMAIMPIIFAIMLPFIFVSMAWGPDWMPEIPALFKIMPIELIEGMSPNAIFILFMLNTMMLPMFLMMPGFIPTLVAAYAIVGEKKLNTLEPLLASPVSTLDIFFGKVLSSLIPTIAITWIAFAIFCVFFNLVTYDILGSYLMPDQLWLLAMFLLAPLFALMSVTASTIVSSKTRDIRSAEHASVVFMIPISALLIGPFIGLFFLETSIILMLAFTILVVDVLLIIAGVKLFNRENILIKWK
jgi:ABC-2 type transport system permease protein